MSFQQAIDAWVADASQANLAALYAEIQRQPNYQVSPDFSGAATAVRSGDHADAIERLEAMMPGAFLSPLAHSLLADAYDARFRFSDAVRERALARAALAAIGGSGDGSRERPWVVLRITDEYDLLAALGERSVRQIPLEAGGRAVDELT